jgi:Zn-dependent peptidase ImmA (M78 family)
MNQPTNREIDSLIAVLRSSAPKRPLSYGESLQIARLQASKLRSWARATTRPDINLAWLLNQTAVPVNLVASHTLGEESGMTTNAISGQLEMYLNRAEPAQRQRFSLLHEFKHVLDFADADRLHAALGSGNQKVQEDQIELIANEFAGQVLMPKRLVVSAWLKTQNLALTASLFNVSLEAMKTRLTKLGLIGEIKPRPRSYFRLHGPMHVVNELTGRAQYEDEVAA